MIKTTVEEKYQNIWLTTNGKRYLEALPHLQKIISGQSFLYREKGTPSMVMDIKLDEQVNQEALQNALYASLERFPYFTGQLQRKENNYFLTHNELPMIVTESNTLRALGSAETNYHLVDVTFWNDKILVSYHHALTDGRGITPFVNTLLYYYFSITDSSVPQLTNIHQSNESMQLEEMAEPFEQKLDKTQQSHPINRKGFQLPEVTNDYSEQSYRYELNIDQKSFMMFARNHSATPAIAISIMMSQAIQRVYPEFDQPIVVNMASDLRMGSAHQSTARNCVGSVTLPIEKNIDNNTLFAELANTFRREIKEHKKQENLNQLLNQMMALYTKLDAQPTFADKQRMMSMFDDMLLNTFILSYSGQTRLGVFESHIEEMHTYMSGTKGLSIEMLAANDKIFVDIMQSFESDVYVKTLSDILTENNIQFTKREGIVFETPNDEIEYKNSKINKTATKV
ncbi:hypothetical protein EFM34_00170 [Leuconostoc suionicum]|uniref:hypothetical protein n=1 Tax=Leuconostoc suionicum TaxID=1511761 RepID=UPI0021A9D1FA|nr:hypothetical protein [Leuconostoc suionicum]MCT4381671.1 hypothetical protein [Leuconostoc suionicum]